MKPIKKEDLKDMIDEEEEFELINVLGEEAFEKKHIPGSVNIPVDDDFEDKIKQRYPDKDTKIVVYCASFECKASPKAAEKLDEMGYTDVYDYEGGVKDWEEAGYLLKGPQAGSSEEDQGEKQEEKENEQEEKTEKKIYRCPECGKKSDKPGKCPTCDIEFEKVEEKQDPEDESIIEKAKQTGEEAVEKIKESLQGE